LAEAEYFFYGNNQEHNSSNQQEGNDRENNELGQDNISEPVEPAEGFPPSGNETGPKSEDPDSLQQKVNQLEQEKEELMNRLVRLQADFDNYRKRTRVEKEELEKQANFNLIQRLLPVIDNLERACQTSGENSEDIREGVQMVTRQFKEILEKEGVTPIECPGEPFDPNCHEAVMVEDSSEHPPNTVLDELQKGYKMKDKVLRASMVKVSSDESSGKKPESE